MHQLYTAGYTGSSPALLRAWVHGLGATLLDIRLVQRSRVPHWNGTALARLLGDAYLSLQELGNRTFRSGGPVVLHDPTAALPIVAGVLERQPAILLCACRDWQRCHRSVAAAYLAEQLGVTVTHLDLRIPPGGTMIAHQEPLKL